MRTPGLHPTENDRSPGGDERPAQDGRSRSFVNEWGFTRLDIRHQVALGMIGLPGGGSRTSPSAACTGSCANNEQLPALPTATDTCAINARWRFVIMLGSSAMHAVSCPDAATASYADNSAGQHASTRLLMDGARRRPHFLALWGAIVLHHARRTRPHCRDQPRAGGCMFRAVIISLRQLARARGHQASSSVHALGGGGGGAWWEGGEAAIRVTFYPSAHPGRARSGCDSHYRRAIVSSHTWCGVRNPLDRALASTISSARGCRRRHRPRRAPLRLHSLKSPPTAPSRPPFQHSPKGCCAHSLPVPSALPGTTSTPPRRASAVHPSRAPPLVPDPHRLPNLTAFANGRIVLSRRLHGRGLACAD